MCCSISGSTYTEPPITLERMKLLFATAASFTVAWKIFFISPRECRFAQRGTWVLPGRLLPMYHTIMGTTIVSKTAALVVCTTSL